MYIAALMDGDIVAKDYFDLNEPLQEGIIILFYLWFTFHWSWNIFKLMFLYSTKINMILIFISNTCIIASMDENVVASDNQYFTPKDCFDLNETLQ